MSKRAKRIGVLLVVSSLGIAGGVLTFPESPAFQHWALNRIEKLARDAGYQLTVERLNLNIWRLQASLEGVSTMEFSGVGFFDAGNLYPSISDFNPFKLRYSPGAGIRIQTPLVLIRLDLGVNVFPRSGEPRYRFAFGIGQAF
jgi:Omp85 superfamily domain